MDKFIKLINSLPINEQDIMLENHFSYLYIKANQFLKLGVDAYRMGDFFRTLENAFDGDMKEYYHMMMERVEEFRKNPPPKDWDGVYRATSK